MKWWEWGIFSLLLALAIHVGAHAVTPGRVIFNTPVLFTNVVTQTGTGTVQQGCGACLTNATPTSLAFTGAGMDADGNFLFNGVPYVVIAGEKVDILGWQAAGYTATQYGAKLTSLKNAGMNAIGEGNWSGGQDQTLFNTYGFYWLGSATLDDAGHNAQGNWCDSQTIQTIVNRFKAQTNILRWYVATELNPQSAITYPTNQMCYAQAVSAIRAVDTVHTVVGDVMVFDTNFGSFLTTGLNQMPFAEMVISSPLSNTGGTGVDIQHIADVLNEFTNDWTNGQRFIAGISITALPEEDVLPPSTAAGAPVANLVRGYLWAIAQNVKVFELLWGPNQRNYCGNPVLNQPNPCVGDADQPAGYLQTWTDAQTAIQDVAALAGVISAPGRFVRITTTPAYQAGPTCNNVRQLSGVDAWMKTTGTHHYVIAVNLAEAGCNSGNPAGFVDVATNGATINVGFTISTVTRLAPDTGAAPSFTGSTITENFVPMGVHVYDVN